MAERTITREEAAAALKAVVAEHGEHKINPGGVHSGGGCRYTGPEGHCLVGEVLLKLGLPLPGEGSLNNGERFRVLACFSPFWPEVEWEELAVALLADTQEDADYFETWGWAARHADA